jgi:hypothetical protein
MINIGKEGTEVGKKAQNENQHRVDSWTAVLLSRSILGDLQKELDSRKQYEEPVFFVFYLFLFFFFIFLF